MLLEWFMDFYCACP